MIFYFHLGYPKTGTKFLQKRIFNKMSEVSYLGKDFNDNLENIFIDIISLSENDFKLKKKIFIELINVELNKHDKEKFIISDERFITSLYLNTKEKFIGNDLDRSISRLYEIFSELGKVKFLIVIRKHTEILESFFYQITLGSFLKFKLEKKKIIQTLKGKKSDQSFVLENFFYNKIFTKILSLSKSSKLIFFEDLKFDPDKFFQDLSEFLDLKDRLHFLTHKNPKINKKWDRRKAVVKILFPNIKNLIRNLFNFDTYKYRFIFLKKNFYDSFFKDFNLKYINFYKNEKLVKEYFKNDLVRFPENIKAKLRKYDYFQ